MSKRLYVGLKPNGREVFWSKVTPTEKTHGDKYNAAIGPFRSRPGADFMAQFGAGNPHCRCVADAERLAKRKKHGNQSVPQS